MGFFGKIKQKLGIGTVSVKVSGPATFNVSDSEIKGTVTVTGKSDQVIESVKIEFEENYTTGRGDDKETKEIKLGEVKLPGFEIKTGEVKTIDFSVPFTYSKSSNEQMAEKGGLVGGLGKMGSFVGGEKSTFQLTATVDVKGAALDPNDIVEVVRSKN